MLVLLFVLMFGQTGSAHSALVISLDVVNQEVSTGFLEVEINLKNASTHTLSFERAASFEIEDDSGGSYHAPFDLVTRKPIGPNVKLPIIEVKANSPSKIRVDLSALHWGRSISSVWPFQPLYDVVPPGKYKLRIITGGINSAFVRIIIVERPKPPNNSLHRTLTAASLRSSADSRR